MPSTFAIFAWFYVQTEMMMTHTEDTDHMPTTDSHQPPHIDLERIIAAKLPGRKLPACVVNYLKRIVHIDEVNEIFRLYPNAQGLDFIRELIGYLHISYHVAGKERFPHDGRSYIFASNHPLGGLDGIILAYVIGQEYDGHIRLMVNDILSFIEPLRQLFIPVNKTGAQGKENAGRLNEFYRSGLNLITFPSGKCSRKIRGRITDPEWKKHLIAKAVQYQRDIVPIHFEGRNSNFFYNLANLRTRLGIKANVEMLYLADEFFKQKGAHFNLTIGEPIPWQTFDKSKSQAQWAEWIRETSYKLHQ